VLILGGNQLAAGGYNVDNSVRVQSGAYMSSTNGTATNNDKYTLSLWVKRASISSLQSLLEGWTANANTTCGILRFVNDDTLDFLGYSTVYRRTTRVFRDISAWYHIVIAVDTTQSTASDRIKMYINGVEETQFSINNNPSQNQNTGINNDNANLNLFRRYLGTANDYFYSGYCAEFCMIDGQALDPTSFGEFDADSGIWKPIDVSGLTFGTNGFYLDFENSGSLGADVSGNTNNFSTVNLATTDQSTDTPTNNYCTLNPLNFGAGTLSEGNLKWAASGNAGYMVFGTIGIDMGVSNQFYWETKVDSIGSGVVIGIAPTTLRWNDTGRAGSYGYYSNGNKYLGTSPSAYGSSFTTGDTIGVLAGNGSITFYKNGVSQGVAWSGLSGTYLPFLAEISNTNSMNFGSPPYTISSGNTDPAGYGNFEYSTNGGYALNTKNLAEYG